MPSQQNYTSPLQLLRGSATFTGRGSDNEGKVLTVKSTTAFTVTPYATGLAVHDYENELARTRAMARINDNGEAVAAQGTIDRDPLATVSLRVGNGTHSQEYVTDAANLGEYGVEFVGAVQVLLTYFDKQ
jgi:hypothetical protein